MPKIGPPNPARQRDSERQMPAASQSSSSSSSSPATTTTTPTTSITSKCLFDNTAALPKTNTTYSFVDTDSRLRNNTKTIPSVSPSTRSQTCIPTELSPSSQLEIHARSLQWRIRTETLDHENHCQPIRLTTSVARERATWADMAECRRKLRPKWLCAEWVSTVTRECLSASDDLSTETKETERTGRGHNTRFAGQYAVRQGENTSIEKEVNKSKKDVHLRKDTHHVEWLGGPVPSLRPRPPTYDSTSIPRPNPNKLAVPAPSADSSPFRPSFITHLPDLSPVEPFGVTMTKTQRRAKERKEKKRREEGQA
ncbi:hypothetical protein PV10_08345 [Exophiala mesophila]|uniref:Uncharacterized protein n=1 Tax=Exophiala mesophila TaxID=212818 RepID=A0A0D1XKF5_EXOME|nr:uncharacterized protein PV10_08345 [Exophiala mesophila]KIV88686.1 hypothetical protein PV10_08345 [Exophiala mesophila]